MIALLKDFWPSKLLGFVIFFVFPSLGICSVVSGKEIENSY